MVGAEIHDMAIEFLDLGRLQDQGRGVEQGVVWLLRRPFFGGAQGGQGDRGALGLVVFGDDHVRLDPIHHRVGLLIAQDVL